jgi:hypothetical protein
MATSPIPRWHHEARLSRNVTIIYLEVGCWLQLTASPVALMELDGFTTSEAIFSFLLRNVASIEPLRSRLLQIFIS